VPPGYATQVDTVCVAPARQERSWIPPRYGTRPKIVCHSDPQLTEKITPAVWGVTSRERVVCPEQEEWKRICCPPQEKQNPCEVQMDCWAKCKKPAVTCQEDCPVCLAPERRCVQYKPAGYKVVEERYLIEQGRWQYRCIPPKFEQKCRQVCVQPGHWEWRRNEACEVPCAPCAPAPCAPAPAPCVPMPPPAPAPLPALQVEMDDSGEGGEDAGIFAVGDTVRYDLRIVSDEGSQGMASLKATFTLPAELEFISGGGAGIEITGSGQSAESATFDLPVGGSIAMYVLCTVKSAPASGLVQLTASVKDSEGFELAVETESTTLKPGS
jgi:hypothetical protein